MLCLSLLLHFTPGLQTFKVPSTQRPAAHYLSWPGRLWQQQVPAAPPSPLIAGRLSWEKEKQRNCKKWPALSPMQRFCVGEEAENTVINPAAHLIAINICRDPASQGENMGSRWRGEERGSHSRAAWQEQKLSLWPQTYSTMWEEIMKTHCFLPPPSKRRNRQNG